jgi:hypothetical protein
MAVFRVVEPCSLVEVYQRFRGPCSLHHQGDEIRSAVLDLLVRTDGRTTGQTDTTMAIGVFLQFLVTNACKISGCTKYCFCCFKENAAVLREEEISSYF